MVALWWRKIYTGSLVNASLPPPPPPPFRVYELPAHLPIDYALKVIVMDYDHSSADDLIGETTIDLENRYLTQHRAVCGLPQTFSMCVGGDRGGGGDGIVHDFFYWLCGKMSWIVCYIINLSLPKDLWIKVICLHVRTVSARVLVYDVEANLWKCLHAVGMFHLHSFHAHLYKTFPLSSTNASVTLIC